MSVLHMVVGALGYPLLGYHNMLIFWEVLKCQ